jgi:hypothetical protein
VADFLYGDVVDLKFTSVSSGVATALLSGVIDIYRDNSTTESTEGVTLTSTFAQITGVNHVRIETTADTTFYAPGQKFMALLSAGTVDGNSVAGYPVGSFTIGYGAVARGGNVMVDTSIATLASQTSFTITHGSTSDDAYNGARAVIISDANSVEKAEGRVSDYTGASKTIALDADPGIFTMAVGDWIVIHSDAAFDATTVSTLVDQIWDETQASHVAAGSMGVVASEVAEIMAGTTMVSTDLDDLIATSTLISAESTATAAVVDGIASGTTMLSTDLDDLIATTTAIFADTNSLDGTKIPDTLSLTNISSGVWDEVLTGATHNVAASAGRRLREVEGALVVHEGTAQGSSTVDTLKFATAASTSDDFYNGDRVVITVGLGIGEHGIITDYDGASRVATMAQNWVIQPDVTSEYHVTPADVDVETVGNAVQTAGDIVALVTTVDGVVDGIASGTTSLSTDIDDLITESTLISAESTASAAVIDGIAAGTTALSTDISDIWATTITELSSAMNGTPTVLDILAFQHMKQWNQNVTTATSGYDIIYTDAGSTMFLANITNPTTASFSRAQYTT